MKFNLLIALLVGGFSFQSFADVYYDCPMDSTNFEIYLEQNEVILRDKDISDQKVKIPMSKVAYQPTNPRLVSFQVKLVDPLMLDIELDKSGKATLTNSSGKKVSLVCEIKQAP
jgi:hypothetical protein